MKNVAQERVLLGEPERPELPDTPTGTVTLRVFGQYGPVFGFPSHCKPSWWRRLLIKWIFNGTWGVK